jgi:hypothetical protein
MGAPRAPGLIELPRVQEITLAQAGWRGQAWLAAALLALTAGCPSSAPLADKSCPCATEQGYYCCDASSMCVTNLATQCSMPPPPPCTSHRLMDPIITHDGEPRPQDGGVDGVQFGAGTEQWASYTFEGDGQNTPIVKMTSDGNGIRIMASLDLTTSDSSNTYAGAGVSFLGNDCVDATEWTGVQFDFAGDVGAPQLIMGVVAEEDVSTTSGDPRAICTAGKSKCFGPNAYVDATDGMHQVPFDILKGGTPVPKLSVGHIVDVQWQLPGDQIPHADFTISNVQFYR